MNKKIAIFTSYLDNIGGAELVTLVLARELNADIYTTNIDYDMINKMGFSNLNIISIGKVPKNPPLRQQSVFWKFRRLNLGKKYDFYIISGDWAMSGLVNNKPNLWYVHSPINEIWEFKDYVKKMLPSYQKPIFELWARTIKYFNKKYIKNAEKLACNSNNTCNRIRKYFNREAVVINPPVDCRRFYYKKSRGYWLSVNRLNIHKRVDMQMIAFSKISNEKLIVIGSYEKGAKHFEENFNYIKGIKPENVEIRSWITCEELAELYAGCKGFITTTIDEDFGITVIEAMASGKPVIAPNLGGYKETVINGKTGILIDDVNEDKLACAVLEINSQLRKEPYKYKNACQKQARKFDTKVFIEKIKEQIYNEK